MSVYHVQETPTHEHLYEKANYSEANWLMGLECKFYGAINQKRDINSDPRLEYLDPVTINIYFDDNPKSKLRQRNWMAESDDLPYVAYISNIIYPKFREFKKHCKDLNLNLKEAFDNSFNPDGTPTDDNEFYINIRRYSIIELPYKMEVTGTQKLIITEIQGDSINPFIWSCKLAPYRDQVDLDPSTPEIDSKIPTEKPNEEVTGNVYLKF